MAGGGGGGVHGGALRGRHEEHLREAVPTVQLGARVAGILGGEVAYLPANFTELRKQRAKCGFRIGVVTAKDGKKWSNSKQEI